MKISFGQRGFTILEALLALLLVSLLTLPLYRLLNTGKRVSIDSRDRFTAGLVASGEMEKLRALIPPREIKDDDYDIDMNKRTYRVVRLVRERFKVSDPMRDSTEKNLREVQIEVFMQERKLADLTGLFGGW